LIYFVFLLTGFTSGASRIGRADLRGPVLAMGRLHKC
jgi:hypothetical protein